MHSVVVSRETRERRREYVSGRFSRWERDNVNGHLRECLPGISWQEHDLGQTRRDLCAGILAFTSVGQLRTRLSALTCHLSGLGSNFEG